MSRSVTYRTIAPAARRIAQLRAAERRARFERAAREHVAELRGVIVQLGHYGVNEQQRRGFERRLTAADSFEALSELHEDICRTRAGRAGRAGVSLGSAAADLTILEIDTATQAAAASPDAEIAKRVAHAAQAARAAVDSGAATSVVNLHVQTMRQAVDQLEQTTAHRTAMTEVTEAVTRNVTAVLVELGLAVKSEADTTTTDAYRAPEERSQVTLVDATGSDGRRARVRLVRDGDTSELIVDTDDVATAVPSDHHHAGEVCGPAVELAAAIHQRLGAVEQADFGVVHARSKPLRGALDGAENDDRRPVPDERPKTGSSVMRRARVRNARSDLRRSR
jgi:hypothetical protein